MSATFASLPPEAWSLCSGLAAIVLMAQGLIHLHLSRHDHEPGLLALGLAALLIAAFYASDALAWNKPFGPRYQGPAWVSLLLLVAIVTWAFGMGRYLGQRPGWRQPVVPLLLLPNLLLVGLHLGGVPVPRAAGNMAVTAIFAGMAVLAWRQRRREPGHGHGWVAGAILLIPAFALAAWASGIQVVPLRYLALAPLLIFYLTLLTVSLRRRQHAMSLEAARRQQAEQALARLNADLERNVHQRTADLHDMVAGLESFNRSVSHDLRGPLGGMEGAAQLARAALDRGDADAVRTLLDGIAEQARVSRTLVVSLLELARVGDADLQRRPVSLEQLTRDAIADVRRQSAGHTLPIFELLNLPTIQADAELLRPAITNLISNACKFSEGQAAPRVEIGCRQQAQEVTVFVRDNGVGFDPGGAKRLFQPFQRLHGAGYAGHGVGLSIVRRAVERHGGQVWAESAPTEGACFYFSLPDAGITDPG